MTRERGASAPRFSGCQKTPAAWGTPSQSASRTALPEGELPAGQPIPTQQESSAQRAPPLGELSLSKKPRRVSRPQARNKVGSMFCVALPRKTYFSAHKCARRARAGGCIPPCRKTPQGFFDSQTAPGHLAGGGLHPGLDDHLLVLGLTTSPGLVAEPASDQAFSKASQSRMGSILVQTSYLVPSEAVFISYSWELVASCMSA